MAPFLVLTSTETFSGGNHSLMMTRFYVPPAGRETSMSASRSAVMLVTSFCASFGQSNHEVK